jgi:hypothetical protein
MVLYRPGSAAVVPAVGIRTAQTVRYAVPNRFQPTGLTTRAARRAHAIATNAVGPSVVAVRSVGSVRAVGIAPGVVVVAEAADAGGEPS